MRTMCLILPNPPKSRKTLSSSFAEQFLCFSPRVTSRNRDNDTLIFIDIKPSLSAHNNEQELLDEAKELALQTYAKVKIAIADTPWAAQALAEEHGEYIGEFGNDTFEINELPLRALTNLEGVLPWNTREVRTIATFFELIGYKKLRELQKYSLENFRERWGKTGGWLWKKLNLQDQQSIAPLEPTDAIVEYMHLDEPTYMMSFLLYCFEFNLKNMCLRLQGRSECANRIMINLYCEYSNQQHRIEIYPQLATRRLEHILKLVENKLELLSLENPIRHFDIEISPVPENLQQLDFFEAPKENKNQPLSINSLIKTSAVGSKYLKLENHLWPEELNVIGDEAFDLTDDFIEIDGSNFKVKSTPSIAASQVLKPTKLLDQPRVMSDREVNQITILGPHNTTTNEDSGWSLSRGRDYYWAINQAGENIWIFKDQVEQKYYLHGYFD